MPALFESIERGEILQLSEFPRQAELLRRIVDAVGRRVARVCGSAAASFIRQAGVERLHEVADPRRLLRIAAGLRSDPIVVREFNRLVPFVAFDVLGVDRPIWVIAEPRLYILPPHRYLQACAPELDRSGNQLAPLDPHQEQWYTSRKQLRFNLWYAVSRVLPENGMIFYPTGYGTSWRETESGSLYPGQNVPRPTRIAIDAGRVLLFAGNHLHGSHLNSTDETRIAVARRFSFERPIERPFRPSRLYKVMPEQWRRTRQPNLACAFRSMIWYWKSLLKPPMGPIHLADRRVRLSKADEPFDLGQVTSFPEDRSTPVNVNGRTFAVFGTGARFDVLDGLCPHRGAWLSDGYRENGCVTCPFHGLVFELATGRCTNFSEMSVRRYEASVEGGRLIVRGTPPLDESKNARTIKS